MSADRAREEPVVFQCQGSALIGILHRSIVEPAEIAVLIVVGGPQYRVGSHRQFVSSARALAKAGFPVFRFDYRGMGDSGGIHAGFEQVTADIRAAVDALCAKCAPRRGVVLLGLCDAASAALMYDASDTRISGLILMNPWVRTPQRQAAVVLKRYYTARVLQVDFWRKLVSGGFDFIGSLRSLVRNLARASDRAPDLGGNGYVGAMRVGFEQFSGPILVVQSGRDLTADEFRILCRRDVMWGRAIERSSVKVVDMAEADHTFSRAQDLAEFNRQCARWLVREFGDSTCH